MNTTKPPETDLVLQAIERLCGEELEREDAGGPMTLDELARDVGRSPFHLQRAFTARTGMSPREFAALLRFTRFRRAVRRGQGVAPAAYGAGFGSSRGLYEAARTVLGMTPAAYARRGRSLAIAFTVEECALGRVLVASTADGVCAVLLGDSDAELCGELRREFAAAALVPARATRRAWTDAVLRHLDDVRVPLGVPLDFHGTPFQVRVWRALRDVAPGERRTYAEVAAAAGAPSAVRAAASACARNAIAVLVPCHRVVRSDGALGGYRWGPARKAALLERETHGDRGPRTARPPAGGAAR